MKQYSFAPDCRNLLMAARNQPAKRLPLYEHAIGARLFKDIIGRTPSPAWRAGTTLSGRLPSAGR